MHAESAEPALREDWHARRERLARKATPPPQLGELHLQILDYLIGRYGDSPEAARPAWFSPKSDLYVNDRAIVVHHHLWQGKVSGVKNRQEAEARVSAILKRMAASGEDRPAEAEHESHLPLDLSVFHCLPVHDPIWRRRMSTVRWNIWFGREVTPLIAKLLERHPFAPIEVIRCLYERLRNLDLEDDYAADLLLQCENPSAPHYGVLAWRERLAAGHRDAVTGRLRQLFCQPAIGKRVVERIRAELANNHAAVRLEAIHILGRIGTLEDTALLSDLLSLPPLEDEHPDERAALARALQRIAQAD
jgi:hypothetical protein